MNFKDFLIYLVMAVLAIGALGPALAFAVSIVVGAHHRAARHCDDCVVRGAAIKRDNFYSSKGES